MDEVSDPALEMETEEAEAPAEDDVVVEEEEESSGAEEALEPVETESEPSLDDSGEEDFVLPIATVDEEPLVKETEEETNHNPISSDSKEKEENSFVFDDLEDSKVLPKAESVENKKPPMTQHARKRSSGSLLSRNAPFSLGNIQRTAPKRIANCRKFSPEFRRAFPPGEKIQFIILEY